ncbi:MAG TPA: hypothetical protein VHQ24_03885 [Lachnospiraceae bacterium]|nr:hypothetical protein [Lachnospiraceae bacterium]
MNRTIPPSVEISVKSFSTTVSGVSKSEFYLQNLWILIHLS